MKTIYTVSDINKYLSNIISGDNLLSSVWIKGEMSNYKFHTSGHMYFTLKDNNSILKCVMFKTSNINLKFKPENGLKIVVKGRLALYERDGIYQIYVNEIEPFGIGDLHIALEKLKIKLKNQGLFDNKHKKTLPLLPNNIGIITSTTGSVINDIINISTRRFFDVNMKIFPVSVQGENAAKQIANAIKFFNTKSLVDVIIIARGGGSFEELWPFNDESLAMRIYSSKIPIVSAIGHETDFTISDLVADVRAPTPSAAAELVIPEKEILYNRIKNLNSRLANALKMKISYIRFHLEKISSKPAFKNPYDIINKEQLKLDSLNEKLTNAINLCLEKKKLTLDMLCTRFELISPIGILKKGYCLAKNDNNIIIKSINDANIGDTIEITLIDGTLKCNITGVEMRDINGK